MIFLFYAVPFLFFTFLFYFFCDIDVLFFIIFFLLYFNIISGSFLHNWESNYPLLNTFTSKWDLKFVLLCETLHAETISIPFR